MRIDPRFDPPRKVIGNLRFTRGGVYADYLLDGLAVTMRSLPTHERAARLTRNLGRNLPSGSLISGLLVADDQHQILRTIVGSHAQKPDWVTQCRRWEPVIAAPAPAITTGYTGPVQRRYWLTVPVDAGRAGRTTAGQGKRLWDWVAGRDQDCGHSITRYARVAGDIISALPDEFHITPASPARILWHHRHNVFRGVCHDPLPIDSTGPDALTTEDFDRAAFDEGANAIRTTRWPTRRPVVRVHNPDHPDKPASYQTFLTVTHFPEAGLKFPRAAYLHALDNVPTTATIDWIQHLTIRTPDLALALNHCTAKNLKDQDRQRGPAADEDDELLTKLVGTRCYSSELKANPAEREIDHSVVIAVGAPDPDTLDDAVKHVRLQLDAAGIAFDRWTGGQGQLWKAFNPGSENSSPINEFRNPTTSHRWSRFMPLISDAVGNATGSPLAVNQTTLRPAIVLHDPEGAARRNHNTGLALVGEPGGGKSNRAKLSGREVVLRGGRVVAFDPGTLGEWAKALCGLRGLQVIDPATAGFSVDPLRIFPHESAAGAAADHILPMLGIDADSLAAMAYTQAIRPDRRAGYGITSHRTLINHLRAQPHPHTDELLLRLEAWAAMDYTRVLFDDTLPPYCPTDAPATVWLTRNLSLPDAAEVANPHLYSKLERRQKAGMALYGLLIDTEQQHMFAHPERFDVMIFEECAELLAYPAGAKTAHRITRQGRKHATGIWLITQDFHDLAPMGDKFVTQKWLFRISDRTLAAETLAWAGIDPGLYPDLVAAYAEDTSPANTRETSDGRIEPGAVDPWRRGEGFMVDEFGRAARVQFLGAPTRQLAAALDTTPPISA
ncbi:ATP-binding protein [Mycobacterium sp.]|uniref:ATP-binding protein n=1 Tax=Mycobacterium sp. TaxID=1785 RepID=UPI002C83B70A|nr:ATP-binding protein [Mycobacterium sp.]HME48089.1 ATP-binding protein [Mycobacterium sp.]